MQEFYGCGKFVSDSWRIFCRGELQLQVSLGSAKRCVGCRPSSRRALDIDRLQILITLPPCSAILSAHDFMSRADEYHEALGSYFEQGVEDVNLRRYLRWASTGTTEDPAKPAAGVCGCR